MATLSLLQITDLHILPEASDTFLGVDTEYYFHAVLKLALADHPAADLIMLTGDLSQDPSVASYQRIAESIRQTDVPCVCLPGNHDDFALMRQVFNSPHINCNKQRVMGNWQIISLNSQIPDSPCGRLAAEELVFLEQCLQEHPGLHALIAVHHHCLPTHSEWLDTMIIENQAELLAISHRYPQTKTIINGHIHQFMDRMDGNIRVLGAPSTCFQFALNSEKFALDTCSPGYRWLRLHDDGQIETDIARLAEPLIGLQMNTQGY